MLLGLDHVVLFCPDTGAARAWYEAVGFTYEYGYEGMHFLRLGGLRVMLHPAEVGPKGSVPELYATTRDLDALFHRVREKGLAPVHHQVEGPLSAPHTTPWGSREFELYDPAGHRWGFVAPPAA